MEPWSLASTSTRSLVDIMASSGGMLKLVADAEGRRVLGVQIAGDGAMEFIHMGQMAIIGQMPVDAFVQSTFNFPTMAEAYRLAALEIIHAREAQSGLDRESWRKFKCESVNGVEVTGSGNW